jgi:hypothetical protein
MAGVSNPSTSDMLVILQINLPLFLNALIAGTCENAGNQLKGRLALITFWKSSKN